MTYLCVNAHGGTNKISHCLNKTFLNHLDSIYTLDGFMVDDFSQCTQDRRSNVPFKVQAGLCYPRLIGGLNSIEFSPSPNTLTNAGCYFASTDLLSIGPI